MQKLYITRGLMGSGKTTYAKAKCQENKNLVRVNRDDVRQMLKPGYQFGNWDLEAVVTHTCHALVKSALTNWGVGDSGHTQGRRFDVICDDTNLSESAIKSWKMIASVCSAELVILDQFLKVPVETCIARDKKRGEQGNPWVGNQVITQAAFRHGLIAPSKTILCDIDGTVANISKRKSKATESGNFDWDIFHDLSSMELDKPRKDVIAMVNDMKKENDCRLVMVSGRSSARKCDGEDKEIVLEWTIEWLKKQGVNFDYILMRQQNDNRPDEVVKADFLKLVGKENVIKVFDDRPKVIRFWRSEGLDVIDVGTGVEF